MDKILVSTDFSPNAYNAFAYAICLAEATGANVFLLHVIELDLDIVDAPILSGAAYKAKKEAAELAMQAQIDLALGNVPNSTAVISKVEKITLAGNPVNQILSCASDIGARMIVMGARGSKISRLQKWLGTRSSAVALKSRSPVLIIPEGVSFRKIIQLGYAADLNPSDSYALWNVLEMIKPFSPVVRYVHVSADYDKEEENQKIEKMSKFLESSNSALQFLFHQVYGKNIDAELTAFSNDYDIDLLVVLHQPKTIFQRLYGPSHTKGLISKLNTPLLIIRS